MKNRPNAAPTPKAPQTALPPEGLSLFARVRVELWNRFESIDLPGKGLVWVGGNLIEQLIKDGSCVNLGGHVLRNHAGIPVFAGVLGALARGCGGRGRVENCLFDVVLGGVFELRNRDLVVRVCFEAVAKAEFSPVVGGLPSAVPLVSGLRIGRVA